MRRQLAQALRERVPLGIADRDPTARGDHRERAQAERPEIAVGCGDGRDQGGLQQLLELFPSRHDGAEDAHEIRIERRQVEQRLVHVEEDHAR